MEFEWFPVEPVGILETREADFHGEVEKKCESWFEPTGGDEIELTEILQIQATGVALVDQSGIRMSIAEHRLPCREGGADDSLHVVAPVGEEQKEFCPNGEIVAVEEEFTDFESKIARSWLPSDQDLRATRLQGFGNRPDGGRLPCAFWPFKGDEHGGKIPGIGIE